ncbi:hypothetical protein D5125_00610 [Magnetovirga frankeli]|uniref:type I restriction endonuclease subunit R, EcoR124 family n=1 Tax=Magnetovirga frankeli TaxID=947516 RepID=UPI0012937965|nr:hypothetical protein D5125_00610 [gamma proteobacterium SS-5]
MSLNEAEIEKRLIEKLEEIKYSYRPDIRDKTALEANFRQKFEALNRVTLTDAEFARLRDGIIHADVFQAAKALREYGYMEREDGTPLHFQLVNLKDWCKNAFEVINQLHINTENSHHRYDVILLLNGLPLVQIELKTLGLSPRKAMEQIIDYRNDPGNGYGNSLLCFMQLFIVSNRNQTFKPEGKKAAAEDAEIRGKITDQVFSDIPRFQRQKQSQQAVVDAILAKHDAATNHRRFNALLATASINDAIAYYRLFKQVQAERQADNLPLHIACVFSPPAEGNRDVKQLQEDLPQEKADNQQEPEQKKAALQEIISDYNAQFGTNHKLSEFDLYYQDIQQRIKDQKYPNKDYPRKNKIDLCIVVDMLLTGFDSQYLNSLYVDKNLKHHGLIQAFSRTNRVLNDTKPYGNILDFRAQEKSVDQAIALFSGEDAKRSREIWLVDPAPQVIEKLDAAVKQLEDFMQAQGQPCTPAAVNNLKGTAARVEFINRFKEIQRLKKYLDQYTDLTDAQQQQIEQRLPEDSLRGFKGMYLETAQRLKNEQGKTKDPDNPVIEQLEFEFVLFSSALIDYDYIMGLIARYSHEQPGKETLSREQIINLLASSSNLMDERDEIIAYINTLEAGKGHGGIEDIRGNYQVFKAQKTQDELAQLPTRHRLKSEALQGFVDAILDRMIFDGEQLSDLFAPLELGWKARSQAELALMQDLVPLLIKQAGGREISGLAAYE